MGKQQSSQSLKQESKEQRATSALVSSQVHVLSASALQPEVDKLTVGSMPWEGHPKNENSTPEGYKRSKKNRPPPVIGNSGRPGS